MKNINYYLNMPWTYTIQASHDEKNRPLYTVCVNELPGVCTDAYSIEEGMQLIKDAMIGTFTLYMKQGEEIPEPVIDKNLGKN